MLKRQKGCSYSLVRKLCFEGGSLCYLSLWYEVNGSAVTLFGVLNVRGGFAVVVLVCLSGSVYFHVKMSLSVGRVWIITAF